MYLMRLLLALTKAISSPSYKTMYTKSCACLTTPQFADQSWPPGSTVWIFYYTPKLTLSTHQYIRTLIGRYRNTQAIFSGEKKI